MLELISSIWVGSYLLFLFIGGFMKFFIGYMVGGTLCTMTLLYYFNKRGVLNVWMYDGNA